MLRSRQVFLRTIRQRRGRARKGQVAAVATVFGLLLVVSFIANFVLLQLPGEMSQEELQHEALVENQISRLQATILAEAAQPSRLVSLTSPVTLGSGAVPPFGPPTPGAVSQESAAIKTTGVYQVSKIVPAPPQWNVGDACASGTGKPCASNSHTYFYNYSANNTNNIVIKITGGNDTVVYNFTGNNDTVTIQALGNSVFQLFVVVNGSDDSFTYQKGGSTLKNPFSVFYFFGQRDTFSLDPSSSKTGLVTVDVYFIGSLAKLCPYGNLSSTDKFIPITPAGSAALTVNVTWWNAVGYVTPTHFMTYPTGGPGQTLSFTNKTGFVQCAFTKAFTTTYTTLHLGGLVVHLYNRYQPAADIAYENGAVILAQVGGNAVMLAPPPFTASLTPSGQIARFTLINMISNFSSQSGVTTAAVTAQLLSVQTSVIQSGYQGVYLSSPFWINITTQYPTAWIGYFDSHSFLFPYGASCVAPSPIPAPYTCLNPPPGTLVDVDAMIEAQSVTVTAITAQIGIG